MLRSISFAALAFVSTLIAASSSVADAAQLQLYGVNYSVRKGADRTPQADKCKTKGEIEQDFTAIASITKRIRIYSLTDCNQGAMVLAVASHHNLLVELGLWVNADDDVFMSEKKELENLATQGLITKELVTAIHVGSEAVYRKEVSSTKIIDLMNKVKLIRDEYWPTIPITIADIGDVYLAHTDLIDAVDFVSANGFPFWEKKAANESAAYFYTRMQPLIEKAKKQNKDFVISETGWASQGVNVNASEASPANAKQYLKDFHALATTNNWKYYYFESFDELWKLNVDPNNTVEAYFGIFNADRTIKSAYADLTLIVPSQNATGSTQESANATGSFNGTSNTGSSSSNASGNTSNSASGTMNSSTTVSGNSSNATSGTANNTTSGNANNNANNNTTSGNASNNAASGNANSSGNSSSAATVHADCVVTA